MNFTFAKLIFTGLWIAFSASALSSQPNDMLLKLHGAIDHPELLAKVQNLHSRLLQEPAGQRATDLAEHVEIYIGPRFVKDGAFVAPEEMTFNHAHKAAFANIVFPRAGCRISRQHFPEGGFAVLLVDGTDPIQPDKALGCVYTAVLTALGEDLNGTLVMPLDEQLMRLEQVVSLLR